MSALSTEAWVALRMIPGVTVRLYGRLLERFGDPGAALEAPPAALIAAGASPSVARAIVAGRSRDEAARDLDRVRAAGARIVTQRDAEYPPSLREIADPPPYLYVRGELRAADRLAVAVVGSRAASAYGRDVAATLGRDLAAAGVTVVSGLAYGIDAAAHGGALAGNGRTIAVLGSGVDVIYPREHAGLAEEIARHGAVVSELFMGTPPLPQHFPVRNRIVSGLARGTVVVEATERSGSLITARAALDQGREVFAVPGPITAARSRGTNLLLQSRAKLVTAAADVLEEIGVTVPPPAAPAAGGSAAVTAEMGAGARSIVDVLADGGADADELVARTGLTPPDVLRMLLELELAGIIYSLPGGTYSLPPEARGSTGITQPLAEHGT
jgi:DNA processing protein